MTNSTTLKPTPASFFTTPLSSQTFISLRKVPSYVWLLNKSACLNLSLAQKFYLSLTDFEGIQQSQRRLRRSTQSSSVFSTLAQASTKLKLRSPLFMRQGQRTRSVQNLASRHTRPLGLNFLHKGSLWQSTYLVRQRSIALLGPALRRRHLNKVTTSFMALNETDQTRIKKQLFNSRETPSKFSKFSSAEARLRLFTRYLKLNRQLSMPLLGVKRRRRRLPKISAYLFLGLRRPPLVVLKTPFTNLWKSFRKTFQRNRMKPTLTKRRNSLSLSGLFRDITSIPRWQRVLPPRPKARLKSSSLRRWSKNLGRFRKEPLHSYFSKRYQRSKARVLRPLVAPSIRTLGSQHLTPSSTTSRAIANHTPRSLSSHTSPKTGKAFYSLRMGLKSRVIGMRTSSLPERVLRETKLLTTFGSKRSLPKKGKNRFSLYLTSQAAKPTYRYIRHHPYSTLPGSATIPLTKTRRSYKHFFKLFVYRLKSKRPQRVFRNRKPFRLKWTPVTRSARRTYSLSVRLLSPSKLSLARLPTEQLACSSLHKATLMSLTGPCLGAQLPLPSVLSPTRSVHQVLTKRSSDVRTTLSVSPLYSPTFVTSMFSFIGYSITSPSRISDVARSVTDYSTDLKYLIFPDVNAAKAAIFRRLNKQRFLMRARTHLFNKIHFGNIEKNPRLELVHKPLRVASSSLSQTTLNNQKGLSVSRNWVLHNELRSICRSTYRTPRIGRIRFKPGYYRIWRLARASAREILGFTSRYQYSLTPKLQRHYFQARSGSQDKLSLTVEFALLTSHLIPDHWSLKELLCSHSVFLNGTSCVNPRLRLFCGDFLQLLINLKYYIALRWLDSWSVLKKTKVSKIFYRKLKPSPTNKAIKTVRKLPHWFFDLQYTHTDIPKYFEVDYFTLSVFLLHDYISFERWLPSRARQLNPLVINMYNWKYIT